MFQTLISLFQVVINGREDITEVNEEVKCKEEVCDRQNPSNKSEKLIITATRHEGECAPNSETVQGTYL